MKYRSLAMMVVNLGLWTVFAISYFVTFSAMDSPMAARFTRYTLACAALGVGLSWASWTWGVATLVKATEQIGLRLILLLLTIAAVVGLSHAVLSALMEPLFFGRKLANFTRVVAIDFISFYFIYCLVYCFGLVLDMVRRDAERRERLIQAEGRAHQAQLMALRLQINPHFLFNALNAVASLITMQRDPEALATLHRLSRFLRLVTETSPHAFSPLADELEMAEEYLSVEAIRFQERLKLTIDVADDATDIMTPNFILQPLIENAIKHGVGATEQQTEIRIAVRRLGPIAEITVENRSDDRPGACPKPEGMGVGLRNVEDRLKALYGGGARMEAGPTADGFRVVLRLPPSGATPA